MYAESIKLFGKKIKIIFVLKKKYNLPRPITYMILLEVCKLKFQDINKYICRKCGEIIRSCRKCN